MSWTDVTSSVSDPSITNTYYYTQINTLYEEAYALATGDYNLYRVVPDGNRQWKDYWLANHPPGLSLFDSTSDIYEDLEILLDAADEIISNVHVGMVRYLGQEHYTDAGDDDTIELMSRGRYLLFRLEFLDVTGFDYSEVEDYWPDMDATSFDQMDNDGDGFISENDLIYFLDEPIEALRGALPSTYTPEVTLRTLWLDMIDIRNEIRNRKWRSKLQSIE